MSAHTTAARTPRKYVWGYSGGAILVTVALVVAPLGYAVWASFFSYSFASPEPVPVGFANYLRMLQDPALASAIAATGWIVLPSIVIEMTLGVAWALAINSLPRGRAIATTLLALPVMVSGASAGMAFRMLFTPEWGPIDNLLRPITGTSIDWLGSPDLARVAIVIADVWQNTPFVMLITLAALAGIPKEVNEAAAVDGANGAQRFATITFPLIRKFLVVALLFRLIDLFRIFDVIFVMTSGGPSGATETISYFIYRQGIQYFDVGYAASLGLVLALITVLISGVLIRLLEGRRPRD
ncbi:carbohydrate ABC transporter permease [Agromyces silvae]|uniref:carbohydrate ABC transporter permease n=1 Tax=Agromyces silvae TaxID=3388266 RepID=UPI00280BAFFF|nr:sugar ABC transporter permease [Agromyces protaetiae]